MLPRELPRTYRANTSNPEAGIIGNPSVEGAFRRYSEILVKPDIYPHPTENFAYGDR